jgi:predicted hydrocarbon binding protein
MEFKAFEPGIELLGQALEFMVAGFRIMPSVGLRILTKHGLVKRGPDGKPAFDREGWFPQQAGLDAFKAIYNEVGSYTIFEIGRQLGLQVYCPPAVNDVESVMKWMDVSYHLFHRKDGKIMYDVATGRMAEGIGHYTNERRGDNTIVVTALNPYPCDFDLGIVTGDVERFAPQGRVVHDDRAPCRKKGADACTYVITL